ncbi:hypothetical protein K435DRAFT_800282 [Dendrothele bispora CBS 962.96]|uniref:Uncharacterized protein n=1 Tax=Dendrothele bispora (strain CBS 962.96) TaxID=1314807 RepID=A0A4S8LU97_DENBC|nr:hypothetical protein K435DRAFT_800282 [Dendrothele bispora CBS 962.96]
MTVTYLVTHELVIVFVDVLSYLPVSSCKLVTSVPTVGNGYYLLQLALIAQLLPYFFSQGQNDPSHEPYIMSSGANSDFLTNERAASDIAQVLTGSFTASNTPLNPNAVTPTTSTITTGSKSSYNAPANSVSISTFGINGSSGGGSTSSEGTGTSSGSTGGSSGSVPKYGRCLWNLFSGFEYTFEDEFGDIRGNDPEEREMKLANVGAIGREIEGREWKDGGKKRRQYNKDGRRAMKELVG